MLNQIKLLNIDHVDISHIYLQVFHVDLNVYLFENQPHFQVKLLMHQYYFHHNIYVMVYNLLHRIHLHVLYKFLLKDVLKHYHFFLLQYEEVEFDLDILVII